jgi:hypothetical protein
MTKKEKEILADIRNKYSPILNFFKMWDVVQNDTTFTDQQKMDMFVLVNQDSGLASDSAKEIAELLKMFG